MSLAIPVVLFMRNGEEVGCFWPLNYQHGKDFVAWFNSLKDRPKYRDTRHTPPEAELSQASRYPHPWTAWSDNCAAERLCYRFRGIAKAKTMAHTRPDADEYPPPPATTPEEDSSLSLLG